MILLFFFMIILHSAVFHLFLCSKQSSNEKFLSPAGNYLRFSNNAISLGSKFKIMPEVLRRARDAIRTGISGHYWSRLCAGCSARRKLQEASPCPPLRPRAPSRRCPLQDIPRCSPYCPSCGTSTRSSYGISATRSLAGSARDVQYSDFRRWAHWRHSGRKTAPVAWNG